MTNFIFSKHLINILNLRRKEIKAEWIIQALREPDFKEVVSEEEVRLWKRIDDFGGRYLRVVVNPRKRLVITAFFDRNFKRRLEENENNL